MKTDIQKITEMLLSENSGSIRRKCASYIVKNKIPLKKLLVLLDGDKTVAMRFFWTLGDILEFAPEEISKNILSLFERRNDPHLKNFDRSIAKFLWLSGIPEKIEGEAADQLFNWTMDAKITVSTKVYAISALYELSKKHKELEHELKIVIEDQMPKCSAAFAARGRDILKKLAHSKIETHK